MNNIIKVGIFGVNGYTGMELARILAAHPGMRLTMASSRNEAGKTVADLYPFMRGLPGSEVIIGQPDIDLAAKECDLVFLAVPHGAAMELAAGLLEAGLRVVDLSADFRLRDAAVYEAWYKTAHARAALLPKAVYGLPELAAEKISGAALIANPGCYPTASILGLYAALKHDLIFTEDLVIDAKSGTTGAGRKAVQGSLFCEVYDSFKAYNLGKHRHTPEIEQEVSAIAGHEITLSFNTHLVPMNRGILATIYGRLRRDMNLDEVHDIYSQTWKNNGFIRVMPKGLLPETRNVRGSMFCDLGVVVDPRTRRLIIVSAIDNLCRGASGQAVANANLMFGLPMEAGLMLPPLMP